MVGAPVEADDFRRVSRLPRASQVSNSLFDAPGIEANCGVSLVKTMSSIKRKIRESGDEPVRISKTRNINGRHKDDGTVSSSPSSRRSALSNDDRNLCPSIDKRPRVYVPKLNGSRSTDKWRMAYLIPPFTGNKTAKVRYIDSGDVVVRNDVEIARLPLNIPENYGLGSVVLANLLPGVIGEEPNDRNNNRFMVFLENGDCDYITRDKMHQVTTTFVEYSKSMIDVNKEFILFMKSYILNRQQNKHQVLVKLQKDDEFYFNIGSADKPTWQKMRVLAKEVDCVKVKRIYSPDSETRMIYCGSTKIKEIWMYVFSKPGDRLFRSASTGSRRLFPLIGVAANGEEFDVKRDPSGEFNPSAIPPTLRVDPPSRDVSPKPDIIANDEPPKPQKLEAAQYVPTIPAIPPQEMNESFFQSRFDHFCSTECIEFVDPIIPSHKFRGYPHLLRPIFYRFKRIKDFRKQLALRHRAPFCRKLGEKEVRELPTNDFIVYIAPCGFALIDEQDVLDYLKKTLHPALEVDDFTFEPNADIHTIVVGEDCYFYDADISKGLEMQQPVSLVNTINSSTPPEFTYTVFQTYPSTMLSKGLNPLATINEFRSSCQCSDNCCQGLCGCSSLTESNTRYLLDHTQGNYEFKRLYNRLPLGIYECNDDCSCDKSKCINRVVQNGTKCLLQVFRTKRKGFGVRTLAYIPMGTFIGTYAGKVKDDDSTLFRSNDYLTELDFIETAEQHKRDYEPAPLVDLTGDATREFLEADRLVIDAFKTGSFTRFINHSCEPNIFVQCVFINSHDLRIPHVAFFASRAIEPGEELGWDYCWTDQNSSQHRKCYCGAALCRNRLC